MPSTNANKSNESLPDKGEANIGAPVAVKHETHVGFSATGELQV